MVFHNTHFHERAQTKTQFLTPLAENNTAICAALCSIIQDAFATGEADLNLDDYAS